MAFIVKHNPWLFHKLQRPYLNRTLNVLQRLEALKQHASAPFDGTHWLKIES